MGSNYPESRRTRYLPPVSIREHGYMNIHDKPFTYYRELLPLAEQLEKVTQVKSAGLFDVQAFKELSLKIKKRRRISFTGTST